MEKISTQDLKAILEKLEEPLRLKDLARQLHLIKDEDILALEKRLKDSQTELDINLVEIPHSENKENTGHIEYVLEYKSTDEKENYDNLNDQELMKVYQGLVFKVNKLKEQKAKLNNSEVKNKYIKALHKYNDLKDIGQVVIGKLAELQGKTVTELYEEYDLDLKD